MQRRLRAWILCGLVIGIGVLAFADNKPIPELITNATNDIFPSFRLAAARALVSAELVTGKTMADLDRLLQEQRSKGSQTVELTQAINEAKAGTTTNVCIEYQDAPAPVQGVNLVAKTQKELEQLTLSGSSSDLRRAAALELIRRLLNLIAEGSEYPADEVKLGVQDIAQPFDSLYELRVYDKQHEDYVFDELKLDMTKYTSGAHPGKVELIEEAGLVLAKIFYAEFLVTLDKAFVRANAGCPVETDS